MPTSGETGILSDQGLVCIFKHASATQKPEFRSCVKVEVAVLGSPSLIVLMVSVGVEHHERRGAGAIVGEFHIHPPSPERLG